MRAPVVTQAKNVLAGAPATALGACALGALGVGDLRFALRGGSAPPRFGARATIVQALAAACGRPVDPAFRLAVAPPLQAVPLPPPRSRARRRARPRHARCPRSCARCRRRPAPSPRD
jgi:hypothetical protein